MDIQNISSSLELGPDGIWHGPKAASLSYPVGGNAECFQVEDCSFWFQHRNHCIVAAVKAHAPQHGKTIFDIGGGNGFVSKGLKDSGFEVALIEPGYQGAVNAKRRGIDPVICATTDAARLRRGSLPAVGLFDVIEHIQDDRTFLDLMASLLVKGGRLYATVPAHSCLWSEEDQRAGHFRRYDIAGLARLFTGCGFRVLYSTYIFRVFPLPIFLLRSLPHKLGLRRSQAEAKIASSHVIGAGISRRIIDSLLSGEIDNIRNSIPMSFGATCLIVAQVH